MRRGWANRLRELLKNYPDIPLTSLQPVALGATKLNSVGFLGINAAAYMALHGDTWEFKELDGYETPIKVGHLNDVVSGDLNNNGRKDLVFLETGKNYLDLVLFEAPHQLVPANRWQDPFTDPATRLTACKLCKLCGQP
jgi:hypothetical protein